MSTSVDTLRNWFNTGLQQGATHMVIMCDTFDYEDYPVYVSRGENPRDVQTPSMGRIMECYSMAIPFAQQASEYRANHWDMPEDSSTPAAAVQADVTAPGGSETYDFNLDIITRTISDTTLSFNYTTARGVQKSITGVTPAFIRESENHEGKNILVGFVESEDGTFARKTFRTDRITNVQATS
jgi:hypothetical protein